MIEYILTFDDGHSVNFKVDPERGPSVARGVGAHPFWTQLSYHQCPNCPFQGSGETHCPAALDIEQIVGVFGNVVSHQKVSVEVRTVDRTYLKQTDVQTAVRSLMGLCLATGGCPVLGQMKGPARLHLPFANVEETLSRMVGSYLMGQYLVSQQGGAPDWNLQGLSRLYADLQEVNIALKGRLDAAAEKDANINAVVLLTGMAMLVSFSLEQQLTELNRFTMGTSGSPLRG